MTTTTELDASYLEHCVFEVRRALMDHELANTMLLSLEGDPPLRFIDYFRNEAMEQLLELAPPLPADFCEEAQYRHPVEPFDDGIPF